MVGWSPHTQRCSRPSPKSTAGAAWAAASSACIIKIKRGLIEVERLALVLSQKVVAPFARIYLSSLRAVWNPFQSGCVDAWGHPMPLKEAVTRQRKTRRSYRCHGSEDTSDPRSEVRFSTSQLLVDWATRFGPLPHHLTGPPNQRFSKQ